MMKQVIKLLLVMLTLFMLAITVNAESFSLTTGSLPQGESSTPSVDSELVTETEGWGNADGVDVQILTIHSNPQQSLDVYKVQETLEKNSSKEIAATVSGSDVKVRVAVDYWYDPNISNNTIIDSVTLKIKKDAVVKSELTLSHADYYNWQPLQVGNKRRERNFYTETINSTNIDDGTYTFEFVVSYRNGSTGTAMTATASSNVTIDNGGGNTNNPYANYAGPLIFDDTLWNHDPNNPNASTGPFDLDNVDGWEMNTEHGRWEYNLGTDEKLICNPGDPGKIWYYNNGYWELLFDSTIPSNNVFIYDENNPADKTKAIQLLMNCFAYAFNLNGDEITIKTADGTNKAINLIDFCLDNSVLLPIGSGKNLIIDPGKLQPGSLFDSFFVDTETEWQTFYDGLTPTDPLKKIIDEYDKALKEFFDTRDLHGEEEVYNLPGKEGAIALNGAKLDAYIMG